MYRVSIGGADFDNGVQLHLLWFSIVPLIASGVFHALNGSEHVAFVDALFMSYSAITVTGLNTVLVAPLRTGQQVLLFVSSLT